jgi:PKD repeat protein
VVGQPVTFTDTSPGPHTVTGWTFAGGNPATSTAQQPAVTWSSPATYTVTLTITRAGLGAASAQQQVTVVLPNAPPVAGFVFSPNPAFSHFPVAFSDRSTGNRTQWAWQFPGGTPSASTAQNPTVRWANPGTYTVTLTVGNSTTKSPPDQQTIRVRDGSIYAIGGLSYNRSSGVYTYYNTVESYDPTAGSWSTKAPTPTAGPSLVAATALDGTIYAIGFSGGGVEAYDPVTNSWSTKAPMPTPRTWFAAATGLDGTIYAIGGYGARGLSTVEAYNPATNGWSTKAAMPTPRWGLAAAVGADGTVYAIGGTGETTGQVNTVEAYNPATNSWRTVAPMRTARFLPAATTGSDGTIYAMGGANTCVPGVGCNDLNTMEAYNPATNSWSTMAASMPAAPATTVAATGADGTIYVFGDNNVAEAYNPTTNSWSQIAPLPTPRNSFAVGI